MGSDHRPQKQLPAVDLSSPASYRRGSEEWQLLCRKVREACEEYGCFELVYEQIPPELRAETFSFIRQIFDLPAATKALNFNPKPYHGYSGVHNLYESFGFEDAAGDESLRRYAELMWPDRRDDDHCRRENFCKTVGAVAKQLEELWRTVEMLILDSYGLTRVNGGGTGPTPTPATIMDCKTLLRIMKYKAPPTGGSMNGLYCHTDKLLSTFLCDDQVSALEIEVKQTAEEAAAGRELEYIEVPIKPTSFVFIVGDPLMAWSNGRMHAAKHRVEMTGNKDRYSLGTFQVPVAGTVVGAPEEMVDDVAGYPKLFKDFHYWDFSNFSLSKEGTDLPSHRMIHAFAAAVAGAD